MYIFMKDLIRSYKTRIYNYTITLLNAILNLGPPVNAVTVIDSGTLLQSERLSRFGFLGGIAPKLRSGFRSGLDFTVSKRR